MPNRIQIPYINPIKFVIKDLSYNYDIRHLDIALQQDRAYSFQSTNKYYQKFKKSDDVTFQIVSNFGPCTIDLVDGNGVQKAVGTATTISNTFYNLPDVVYKCNIDISGVDEDYYYIILKFGSGSTLTTLISEPLYISDDIVNTALFEYNHSINYGGAIFQNGETLKFRCEAILTDFQPQSDDTLFADQNNDLVMLSSFPYRTWKLIVGDSQGVADWVVDKLNHILALDTILIDGKQFVKNSGAKWEPNRDRNIPVAGWTIELREAFARTGITIENDLPLDRSVVVEYIIEEGVFGNVGDINILKVQ